MKHKLFLIGILSRDINILLLDEPLTALDSDAQQVAIEVINKFASEGNMIIFTSHIESIQKSISTKFLRIKNNKLSEEYI